MNDKKLSYSKNARGHYVVIINDKEFRSIRQAKQHLKTLRSS